MSPLSVINLNLNQNLKSTFHSFSLSHDHLNKWLSAVGVKPVCVTGTSGSPLARLPLSSLRLSSPLLPSSRNDPSYSNSTPERTVKGHHHLCSPLVSHLHFFAATTFTHLLNYTILADYRIILLSSSFH